MFLAWPAPLSAKYIRVYIYVYLYVDTPTHTHIFTKRYMGIPAPTCSYCALQLVKTWKTSPIALHTHNYFNTHTHIYIAICTFNICKFQRITHALPCILHFKLKVESAFTQCFNFQDKHNFCLRHLKCTTQKFTDGAMAACARHACISVCMHPKMLFLFKKYFFFTTM